MRILSVAELKEVSGGGHKSCYTPPRPSCSGGNSNGSGKKSGKNSGKKSGKKSGKNSGKKSGKKCR